MRDLSSAEITCPYYGAEALDRDASGKQDHTTVSALQGAERRLRPERKQELRRLLERQISEGRLGITAEWRLDEDDGEWEQYNDADKLVKVHSVDEMLEMDFNEILEMGR